MMGSPSGHLSKYLGKRLGKTSFHSAASVALSVLAKRIFLLKPTFPKLVSSRTLWGAVLEEWPNFLFFLFPNTTRSQQITPSCTCLQSAVGSLLFVSVIAYHICLAASGVGSCTPSFPASPYVAIPAGRAVTRVSISIPTIP